MNCTGLQRIPFPMLPRFQREVQHEYIIEGKKRGVEAVEQGVPEIFALGIFGPRCLFSPLFLMVPPQTKQKGRG